MDSLLFSLLFMGFILLSAPIFQISAKYIGNFLQTRQELSKAILGAIGISFVLSYALITLSYLVRKFYTL